MGGRSETRVSGPDCSCRGLWTWEHHLETSSLPGDQRRAPLWAGRPGHPDLRASSRPRKGASLSERLGEAVARPPSADETGRCPERRRTPPGRSVLARDTAPGPRAPTARVCKYSCVRHGRVHRPPLVCGRRGRASGYGGGCSAHTARKFLSRLQQRKVAAPYSNREQRADRTAIPRRRGHCDTEGRVPSWFSPEAARSQRSSQAGTQPVLSRRPSRSGGSYQKVCLAVWMTFADVSTSM